MRSIMYKYLKLFSFLFFIFSPFDSFAYYWNGGNCTPPDYQVSGWGIECYTPVEFPASYSIHDNKLWPDASCPVGYIVNPLTKFCVVQATMYNCPDGLTTVDSLSKCSNSVACSNGTTVFSPATCSSSSWDFWINIPSAPTVCPTGETICSCAPYNSIHSCGDSTFDKYFFDWTKDHSTILGFALGTTKIINPALLFAGEKLLMSSELVTNGGNVYKITSLEAEVPTAVRNSALIEYIGKNPTSQLATNFLTAASTVYGSSGAVVPYSGGLAVSDGFGGYTQLTANQIGSIVDSNNLLSTSFSNPSQAATALQPYFKFGSVPTFTAAVGAIEGDFKRIYDSDPKTQPLYFPVSTAVNYTNDANLATAPKMAVLPVAAPLSYATPTTSTSTTSTTYNSAQTSTATTTSTSTTTSTTTQTITDTVVVSPLPGLPDVDSIEATNNRIFSAFSSFLAPFDSLRSAVSCDLNCPTATFVLFGRDLVMDEHCILFSDIRPLLHIVMLAVWALSGLYIVLKA